MTATPLRLGRYVLISEIARGAYGRLSTACRRHDSGEGEAALVRRLAKAAPLDEEALDPIREAVFSSMGVTGEHLARIKGIEETDEEIGVVFEYADGKDLKSLLALAPLKHLRIPVGVALDVVASALEGLGELRRQLPEELHTAALWPDSVFVHADGRTCLLDPAVAAAIARVPGPRKFRQLIGYCAPEEFDDGADRDQSDVFRAGVLLWEMLSGKRLFSGGTTSNIQQVQNAPIPPLDELVEEHAPLAEVVMRALERDRDARYPSTDDLLMALADCGVPRATDEEVAAYLHELLGIGLAAQKRAVAIALERLAPPPGETPGSNPFASLAGLSATDTLRGVPEPAILPPRSYPPPPSKPPPPMAGSEPLSLPAIDDLESPLASQPEPPRAAAESLDDSDLVEQLDSVEAMPLPALRGPLPPLPAPLPPPPRRTVASTEPGPIVQPSPVVAAYPLIGAVALDDAENEPAPPPAPARPFAMKRAHLIAAAAALGVLLLSVGVLALMGASGSDSPEASASASAAPALELASPAGSEQRVTEPRAAEPAPTASVASADPSSGEEDEDEDEAPDAAAVAEEPEADEPAAESKSLIAAGKPKTAKEIRKQKRAAKIAAWKKAQAAALKKRRAKLDKIRKAQAAKDAKAKKKRQEKLAAYKKAQKAKAAAAKKKAAAAAAKKKAAKKPAKG